MKIAAHRTPVRGNNSSTTRKTPYSIRSLVLGLEVLEAIVKSGREKGISELAAELGTTKWRIFRQLHTLCDQGYVRQNGKAEKFNIGPRVYALLTALQNRFDFVREARPELVALREERGQTTVLAVPVGNQGVAVVDAEPGVRVVQFNLKVGAILDFHASAHGKTALAFGPPELFEYVIARKLVAHTSQTITDPSRLRRDIARIQARGWAVAPEESFRGVNAVAAPVRGGSGRYMGSIGIFGSIDQISRSPNPKDIEAVLRAASRLSEKLKGRH